MDKLNEIVLTIQHYLADYILIIALLGGGEEPSGDCSAKKVRLGLTACPLFRRLQQPLQHR